MYVEEEVSYQSSHKKEDVLPSSSSNYSLTIETYQTDFKPGHEIENNFNKPPN